MTTPQSPAAAGNVLDQSFEQFMTALGQRQALDDLEMSLDQRDTDLGFREIREAFAMLRDELGLPDERDPDLPLDELADGYLISAVDEALAQAREHDSGYQATPEWQRIRAVHGAFRNLTDTIRHHTRGYYQELASDVRARGFLRLVAGHTCKVISRASRALARQIEGAGFRGSPAWQATWRLHRAADNRAAQLLGYIPAGHSLDIGADVAGMMAGLRYRLSPASAQPNPYDVTPKEPGAWDGFSVPGGDLSRLQRAVSAAAPYAEALKSRGAWAAITMMTRSARDLAAAAIRSPLRPSAEVAASYTTLQSRAVEDIAHDAADLMVRLEADGNSGSPEWDAVRRVRDAAAGAGDRIRDSQDTGGFRQFVQVIADIDPDEDLIEGDLRSLVNQARQLMGEPPLPAEEAEAGIAASPEPAVTASPSVTAAAGFPQSPGHRGAARPAAARPAAAAARAAASNPQVGR